MSSPTAKLTAVIASLLAVAAAAAIGSWAGRGLRARADSGGTADVQSSGPYRVVVSIAPLKGLVEGLLDQADPRGVEIETLIPPGASEHGYEIPPSKLARLARADLIVYVGLGLEPQVERFLRQNPSRGGSNGRGGRQVVCFADVVGIHAAHDHHHHHHEEGEECDHGSEDPHLWLDPVLVGRLVEHLGGKIAEARYADPDQPQQLEAAKARTAAAAASVQTIDDQYRSRLRELPRRTIVVGHDAWRRMAQRYDLQTVAIKGLSASEPTPAAIQAAINAVREHGLTTVFVEPQLSQAAGRRIAQASEAKVAILDPLGDGDWHAMMLRNLDALVAALADEPAPAEPAATPAAGGSP